MFGLAHGLRELIPNGIWPPRGLPEGVPFKGFHCAAHGLHHKKDECQQPVFDTMFIMDDGTSDATDDGQGNHEIGDNDDDGNDQYVDEALLFVH